MRARGFVLLAAVATAQVLPALDAAGQARFGPSPVRGPFISGKQAAAAGLLVVLTFAADPGLRSEAQEHRDHASNSIAAIGNSFGLPRYMLPLLGAGYALGHLSGSPALRRAMLQAGSAALLASGITTALKYSLGRGRPGHMDDGDEFHPFSGSSSFPSGHTTFAFAIATAIAEQTPDRWSDVGLYGVATLTAFARVNDDRHWTSDVIAGALVGHLSARWLSRRQGRIAGGAGTIGVSFQF